MIMKRTLMIAFLVSVSLSWGLGQSSDYWLIKESKGAWQYRVGKSEPRQLTGRYDYLIPAGEVRCMEKDIRNCELRYLVDPRSDKTERLPIKLVQSGRWYPLLNLKPPTPPVLPVTSTDLVAKFKRVTQAGGSRSGSVCGGDFALKAPACGDTVDVSDFKVQWVPMVEDAAKRLSILVERIDGKAALFRGTPLAASGEYADDKLLEFLKKHQGRNDVVDIAVRVLADSGRNAVRLVHIPPSVRTERYQSRLREIETLDPLLKSVQTMALAMDEGMWSKAGEEACKLMALTPGAPDLQEYALAGLCQSDFEEEKSRLRGFLSKEKYDLICTLPTTVGEVAAAETQPSPPAATAVPRDAGSARLGVALVIANSDYWNLPLNSVKSDAKSMKETLEALGFQVTVKENLRNPSQFQAALDEVLKKENATPEDILLVYYSGHGLQLDGKAHLLGTGVSATARVAEDVRSNAQSAEGLLAEMERAAPGVRILIVEACRNNVLTAPSDQGGQSPRAGFAFQQDDVPNTFVMFANRPGQPTPVRSDFGLMGPFTESLILALQNSSGEIQEIFSMAAKKTAEMSQGQEPVIYMSKKADQVILRQQERKLQGNRAADLLNAAALLYRDKVWDEFLVTVERAQALAMDDELKKRLAHEVEFVHLVISAAKDEENSSWNEAASRWQMAGEIFPARQWVTMKAAIAWLMADKLNQAVRSLAVLGARSESELAAQARQILGELVKDFPELEAGARTATQGTAKLSGPEFELVGNKESKQ